jgi:acyl-CoA synthetase (AMP-forming)/AMP-acid ligase II
MVMANDPESVALLFALSCSPNPLIILPVDSRAWRTSPCLPHGTPLILPPRLQGLAADAKLAGLDATVLPQPDSKEGASDPAFMSLPGFVLFTSGSTGPPRPVFRSTRSILDAASTLAMAARIPSGSGVIGAVPLSGGFGLIHALMLSTVLGARLGLLERFDLSALLTLFASRQYHYWAGTPVMTNILSRCPLPGAHPAPEMCVIAGRLPASVCRAFEARFGVPLRQTYGTTESGPVTVDTGPPSLVRSRSAGRPLPGVSVRIGDDPRAPASAGEPGRIWLSTPLYMDGYGFPPAVEPAKSVGGWHETKDTGYLDEAGYLMHTGRVDDCVRTRAGYLVNPGDVAAAIEGYAGVKDAAVVPLDTHTGPVLGALVEATPELDAVELRSHLGRTLPPWAQPRVLEITRELPRLPGGRTDRMACVEILTRSLARTDT